MPNKISWNHSPDQAIQNAIFVPIKSVANTISLATVLLSFSIVSRAAHKSRIIALSTISLHAIGIRIPGSKRS